MGHFCMTFKMVPEGIKLALFDTSGLARVQKKCKFYGQGCHFSKGKQKSPIY